MRHDGRPGLRCRVLPQPPDLEVRALANASAGPRAGGIGLLVQLSVRSRMGGPGRFRAACRVSAARTDDLPGPGKIACGVSLVARPATGARYRDTPRESAGRLAERGFST